MAIYAVMGWCAPAWGESLSIRRIANANTDSFPSIPRTVGLAPTFGGGLVVGVVGQNPLGGPADLPQLVGFPGDGSAAMRVTPGEGAIRNLGLAIDDFGQLSYLTAPSFGSYRVGNELSGWPDLTTTPEFVDTAFPDGGPNSSAFPFSYALDQRGLPVVSTVAANLLPGPPRRFVWRFNPQTAGWDRAVVPTTDPIIPIPNFAPQSIAFTPDNALVHAFVEGTNALNTGVTVQIEDEFGALQTVARFEDAAFQAGVSVAASDDGEVAFVFGSPRFFDDGLLVGRFDGEATSVEVVRVGSPLTSYGQRSLAYDSAGNLALVYTDGETVFDGPRPLNLARQAAAGVWTSTPLGIDAFYGEIAFGNNGELYIGAVMQDAVVLLSDAVDPLRGDLDFNEVIDLNDTLAFVQAIEDPQGYADAFGFAPTFKGDFTGDGVVNLSDVEPFVAALGLTGASAEAFLRAVPEPGVGLSVALAGVLSLCLRRNQVCPVRENARLPLN